MSRTLKPEDATGLLTIYSNRIRLDERATPVAFAREMASFVTAPHAAARSGVANTLLFDLINHGHSFISFAANVGVGFPSAVRTPLQELVVLAREQQFQTWSVWQGNSEGAGGLSTNVELQSSRYFGPSGLVPGYAARSAYLNEKGVENFLHTLGHYKDRGVDAWSKRETCAHAAATLWRSAVGEWLDCRYLGFTNPSTLSTSIVRANEGKQHLLVDPNTQRQSHPLRVRR